MKLTDLAGKLKLDKEKIAQVLRDAGMQVSDDTDLDSVAVEKLLQDVDKLTAGIAAPAVAAASAVPESPAADSIAAAKPVTAPSGEKKKINPSLSELAENLGIKLEDLAEQAAVLGVKTADVEAELSEAEGNLILDNLQVIVSAIGRKKSEPVPQTEPVPGAPAAGPQLPEPAAAQPGAARAGAPARMRAPAISLPSPAYAAGAAVFFIAFLVTAMVGTHQRPAPVVRHEEAVPSAGHEQDTLQARLIWKTAEEGFNSTAYELCQDFIRDFPESRLLEDVYFKRGEILFAWERKLPSAQYGAAAAAFNEALAKFPDSARAPRALHLTASAYVKLNVQDKAAETLALLLSRYPSYEQRGDALFQYASCLAELKRFREAAASCTQFLRMFPRSPQCADALYMIAQCRAQERDVSKAVAAYTAFLARFPKDARRGDALFSLAGVYYGAGKYEQAFSLYRKTLGHYPWDTHNDRAFLMLAECRAKQNEFEDAGKYLDELIYTYPDSSCVSQAQYRKADFLLAQAEPVQACAQYEKALAKYPKHERAYTACVTLAKLYFASAKYSHCVRVCGTVLTRFRNAAGNDAIRMMMAQAYKEKKDYLRALDNFGKLIEDYPASGLVEQAYFQKADCQFALGLYPAAVSTYVRIFGLFPQTVRRDVLLFRLGECSFQLGKYEDAKNYYSDCIAREPLSEYSRRARISRARCLARLGNVQQAHDDLRSVLKEPALRAADYFTAACLEEARLLKADGKYVEAAETAAQGLGGQPLDPAYLDCLRLAAEAYRSAGAPDRAEALWQGAVAAGNRIEAGARSRQGFIAECRLGLADAQFLAGKKKEALSNYLFAARQLTANAGKSWALFQAAEILLRDGKRRDAAVLYARIDRAFPESYWRKQAQWRLGTLTKKVK